MEHLALVDLNNFARYPTLSIGYIAAILRRAGFKISVISPLSVGFNGVPREPQAGRFDLLNQRFRYWSAWNAPKWLRRVRKKYAARRHAMSEGEQTQLLANLQQSIDSGVKAVMLSTYLMYYDVCRAIAEKCAANGIPVLVGGPYFAQRNIAETWAQIPGVHGVATGELEPILPALAQAMLERQSLEEFPGVCTFNSREFKLAAPLRNLDALPYPDFSDFPWGRYPHRIVPIIAGRGCGWGACTFCSDITSGAGRTFRSRSPNSVLAEIGHQSSKCESKHFVFTDLKLNSDPTVWSALSEGMQARAPGARWIASVHVDSEGKNGLSRVELAQARKAGMVRLTTGLESGSQRVLDAMRKGTTVEGVERFVRDASQEGISVRLTMIAGFPGEKAADVAASAAFLTQNISYIDRVSLNRHQVILGTQDHKKHELRRPAGVDVQPPASNPRLAVLDEINEEATHPDYQRSTRDLLAAVHAINRRPLPASVSEFDGVM